MKNIVNVIINVEIESPAHIVMKYSFLLQNDIFIILSHNFPRISIFYSKLYVNT
jgi:hypothetical protein